MKIQVFSLRLLLAALALGALCAGQPVQADPTTPPAGAVFVSPSGSDSTGLGTLAAPFATVERGLDEAWADIPTTSTKDHANIWTLFDNAVKWADGVGSLPVSGGRAALVVGNPNLYNRTPDFLIKRRLQANGYDVEIVDDNFIAAGVWTSATQAIGKDLIVISESVSSGNTNELRGVPVPIINMDPFTWDNWGYVNNTDAGINSAVNTQLEITAAGAAHPLGAGFAAGNVTVYSANYALSCIDVGPNPIAPAATVVGTYPGTSTRPCLWALESGAALFTPADGNNPITVNPARAVGFFLFATRPDGGASTDDFDATVSGKDNPDPAYVLIQEGSYAIGQPLGVFANLTVQGGWNAAFDDQTATRTTTLDGGENNRLMLIRNGNSNMSGGSGGTFADSSGAPDRSVSNNAVIDSLVFFRGRADNVGTQGTVGISGGAMYIDGVVRNVTISRCAFNSNAANDKGGAVFIEGTYADGEPTNPAAIGITFRSCSFTSNTTLNASNSTANNAGAGAAIGTNNGIQLTLDRCLFTQNVNTQNSYGIIGLVAGSSRNFVMTNCVVVDNLTTGGTNRHTVAFNGGESNATGRRTQFIYNNTFYGNRQTGSALRDQNGNASAYHIVNNIFAENIDVDAAINPVVSTATDPPTNDTITATRNIAFNNNGMTDGLIAPALTGNPQFVDAPGGDFSLVGEASAAYDAGVGFQPGTYTASPGDEITIANIAFDFDGNPRPSGPALDIGAFESQTPAVNAASDWMLF
jgi:hypothetical protein